MKWFKGRSIQKQLWLFTSFTAISLLVIQISFFIIINSSTYSVAKQYLNQLSLRVENSVDHILEDIKEIGKYVSSSSVVEQYASSQNDVELIRLKGYLDQMVLMVKETNQNVYNVLLYRASHRVRYSYGVNESKSESDLFNEYSTQFENEHHFSGFMLLHSGKSMIRYPAYIIPVYSTKAGRDFGSFEGTIVVLIQNRILDNALESTASRDNSYFYLVDSFDNMISHGGNIPQNTPRFSEVVPDYKTYIRNIEDSDWKLMCFLDMEHALNNYNYILTHLVLLVLLTSIPLLLLLYWFRKNIVLPIQLMYEDIDKIIVTDKQLRIMHNFENKEMEGIATIINRLLDHSEESTKTMLSSQRKLYQAELDREISDMNALVSQINPHFMLNTLQCINGISMTENVYLIPEIVNNMSSILKYCLRERDIVTVDEELNIVRNYLAIIDIRFMESFLWNIEIDNEILECPIPKMILQPLVENSVYHGLEKKGEGTLNISCRIEDQFMHFVIQDTGIGITPEELERIQLILNDDDKLAYASIHEKRIGLVNINRRLKYMYGDPYSLKVHSVYHEGTRVEFTIPMSIQENRKKKNPL